jgi:tetratricopeptide (TPR) repeat protein
MSTAKGPRDPDESKEVRHAVTEAADDRLAPNQVEAITQIVLDVAKNLQESETQKGFGERFLRGLAWIVASWAFFAFLFSVAFVGIGLHRKEISLWRVVEESVTPYNAAERRDEMVKHHRELGNSFLNIGQPRAARTEFEHVLRLDPDNVRAETGILKCDPYIPILEENYNLEVQEQRVQFLLEANPNDSHGNAFLGTMLTEVDQDLALQYYERAVKKNRHNAEAYYGMGNIYLANNGLDKASKMYQRARDEASWNPKYNHAIAYISYRKGHYVEADAQLQELYGRDPQYLWSYPDIALTGQQLNSLAVVDSFQRRFISLLEDEKIVSMEKNQGTLARHARGEPVYLSQPSEKLSYAYYNAALTSYLLGNEKDAKQYIQTAQDQQLDLRTKEQIEQIVEEDIALLESERPTRKQETDEFLEFMNSGEATLDKEDPKKAPDPSTSKGEGQAIERAVSTHYEAIGEREFKTAYSYFGPKQRNLVGRSAWISAEKSYGIESSHIRDLSVAEEGENSATAVVDVRFEDKTGTPRFLITWKLVKEDEKWKLDEQLSATRL